MQELQHQVEDLQRFLQEQGTKTEEVSEWKYIKVVLFCRLSLSCVRVMSKGPLYVRCYTSETEGLLRKCVNSLFNMVTMWEIDTKCWSDSVDQAAPPETMDR